MTIYTKHSKQYNLQRNVYCPLGVLGAGTSLTSSSERSAISNVEVDGFARISLEILVVFSGVLLSSVRMSASLKQVCFSDQYILERMSL
jgi:hypothetical protein